uniref:Reverse transcriptase domain-containing protein n=1 Tax=Lepisosteus oculatus TaxID=7918 RepID=W5LXG6_LEPOC
LAYADDVDLLGRNVRTLKENFIQLEEASTRAGLTINMAKTKYMVMTRKSTITSNALLEIQGYQFEKVTTFKYLGSLISEKNEISLEIGERINAGNRCYFSVQDLMKTRLLSMRQSRMVIRPVVTYAVETWVLTKRDVELLNMWERKILFQEGGEWRIRTNLELYELYEDPPITAEVRAAQLRWLGHL